MARKDGINDPDKASTEPSPEMNLSRSRTRYLTHKL